VVDERNKVTVAKDALCDRPTILRAFAVEAGFADELAAIRAGVQQAGGKELAPYVEQLRHVYVRSHAFARTEQLMLKLRDRARQAVAEFPLPDLRELMQFLIGIVLPARNWSELLA